MSRRRLADWQRALDAPHRGAWARVADQLLAPAAGLYAAGVALRNAAYDRGWRRVHSAGLPTLGLGGLAAGGSGKTPLAAELAGQLAAAGRRPLLVARGYGAPRRRRGAHLVSDGRSAPRLGWREAGEEAILLTRLAPGIPVAVARRREEGLAAARGAGLSPDCLVLDGAFQHRRLRLDLNLVSLDVARPAGGERLLPRGLRREPWSSLRRADWVVLYRAERCRDPEAWSRFLDRWVPEERRAWCAQRWLAPRELGTGRTCDWRTLAEQGRYAVWTALARPASFLAGLGERGIPLAAPRLAADHAAFDRGEARRLTAQVCAEELAGVLTTEKDAVKLEGWGSQLPPVYVIGARPEWRRGAAALTAALHRLGD
jgi:tetraacyldisaccharide 4'-kinase